MTTPHKHYDIIVAWAAGKQIEYKSDGLSDWTLTGPHPGWYENCQYRIKPAPKPDRTQRYQVEWPHLAASPKWHQKATLNLALTFDGETGVLKEAEVF